VSKGILARKVGMTQIFTPQGTSVPVTVLEADTCRVVQRKTVPVDGYDAVQLGFGDKAIKRTPKPMRGHFKRAGLQPQSRLQEVRGASEVTVGTRLTVEMFTAGQRIDVTGISQGKGFSGQHKRHNFHRGPVSHGSHNIKQAGSIGSTDAARVFKGLKMAGQHGATRVTVRNLEIIRVDGERNLLLVHGSVPGHKNTVVMVRDSDRSASLVDAE
jgi:large subunit ribosomal protein L3